ncbi:MAG: hypothetical protein R3E74_03175 [Pseudomonadales bacterium]
MQIAAVSYQLVVLTSNYDWQSVNQILSLLTMIKVTFLFACIIAVVTADAVFNKMVKLMLV